MQAANHQQMCAWRPCYHNAQAKLNYSSSVTAAAVSVTTTKR